MRYFFLKISGVYVGRYAYNLTQGREANKSNTFSLIPFQFLYQNSSTLDYLSDHLFCAL